MVLGTVTDQFLRYNFSVGELLHGSGDGSAGANNTLEVEFDGTDTNGRYMACTGGWDWGPYSNTYAGPDHTFSYGLWKGGYIASTAAQGATIVHASPFMFYRGAHPVQPLSDGSHAGFDVRITVLVRAGSLGAAGTVKAVGSWGTPGSQAANRGDFGAVL